MLALPIVMTMVAELADQANRPLHAYYVFTQADEPIYTPLSVILLQLLQQRMHILRHRAQSEELYSELHELQQRERHDQTHTRYGSSRLDALQNTLLRVLSFFDASETVHLVIDRADR